MASEWTDDLKKEVIQAYLDADPTPETTLDILQKVAEDFEKTPNGVRLVLTKAGVYVKKGGVKTEGESKKGGTSGGGKRTSRQDSIDALNAKIKAVGGEIDIAITDKLTGKAAIYFTNLLNTVVK